ncbi:uncharacterized protein TNCV_4474401 [Trichonephila clavipes]|nr:uncharacterized protein TNCV_4474401 [Trichonephila clavipes]
MAQRLGISICKTARLVGCSRSTVVSTYVKWVNDGETSSRRHDVGCLHAIKEKSHRRLSRMVKMSEKKELSLYEAFDFLQNRPSELRDALTNDSSDEEVPANNTLGFSSDSK